MAEVIVMESQLISEEPLPLYVTPEALAEMEAQYGDVISFPAVGGRAQMGKAEHMPFPISPAQRFVLVDKPVSICDWKEQQSALR